MHLLFILLGCAPLDKEAPRALVIQLQEQVREANGNATTLAELLDTHVDWSYVAAESMSRDWKELSDKDRQRFTTSLQKLITTRVTTQMDANASFELSIEKATWADTFVGVRTRLAVNKENPVITVVTLRAHEGRCRIVDVTVEEDSVLGGYQEQFARLMHSEGFAGLMRRMSQQTKQLAGKPPRVKKSPPVVGDAVAGLSREIIARVIHRNMNAIRGCFEKLYDTTPPSKIPLSWTITSSGRTRDVEVKPTTPPLRKDASQCLKRVVQGLRFPKPRGGEVSVTYPLNIHWAGW